VDNESAEVTSTGKSFHVCGPTTGKARLVGDGCQLDQKHCQTVGGSRTERSAAMQAACEPMLQSQTRKTLNRN